MDETFTLNYGECFVQITDPVTKELKVIEGPVRNYYLTLVIIYLYFGRSL